MPGELIIRNVSYLLQGPLAPVQEKSAKQTIRTVQKYEYPLIFDNEK